MATVLIPTPLRRFTGGQAKLAVASSDIAGLIQAVDQEYPGIAARVLDGDGNVKRFINIFVNDDEIRTLQGLTTPVGEHDQVSIVPAMAGGALAGRSGDTMTRWRQDGCPFRQRGNKSQPGRTSLNREL